jgi:hypothetical protein
MSKATNSIPEGWVDVHTLRRYIFTENPDFLSPFSVRLLCKKHNFPHLKLGKRLFFNISEVQKFIEANSVRVTPEECKVR